MNFKEHSNLRGNHSFLSASKYHWVNYTEEKLARTYANFLATQRGTQLHDFAEQCIRLRVKLPTVTTALNMFVNDAIGFRMKPEQPLFYSPNAFGTADAISFRNNELRIHDLKTGVTRVSMTQLTIYAALFCLEYNVKPDSIELIELRVYQGDQILVHNPLPEEIEAVMTTIIRFDEIIDTIHTEME